MSRRWQTVGVLGVLTAAILCAVANSGCVRKASQDDGSSDTGTNPAAGRMGALAGIPPESDIPSGGVIPNPSPLLEAGRLAAANTEAGNLKAAVPSYIADHPIAARLTSNDLVPTYVSALPKAGYYLTLPAGLITRVDSLSGGWADIVFSLSQQKWVRGNPDNNHDDDRDVP